MDDEIEPYHGVVGTVVMQLSAILKRHSAMEQYIPLGANQISWFLAHWSVDKQQILIYDFANKN